MEGLIRSVYQATDKVLRILEEKGFIVDRVKPANFQRHRIIEAHKSIPRLYGYKIIRYKIYVVYQREPLRAFKKLYNYSEDVEAIGINHSILKGIVDAMFDYIIFVFSDGRIYAGDPEEIFDEAESRGWIRESKKTGEKIINYPVTLLSLISPP